MEFCSKLTARERAAGRLSGDMKYTLPTEAQWEYACRERGQSTGPFHYGTSLSSTQADALREWVRDGGHLIVSVATKLEDYRGSEMFAPVAEL